MTTAYDRLYKAISEHLDDDQLAEVCEHGADTGWAGFAYTSECVEFYETHEQDIYELLRESADSCGHKNVDELVSTFNRSDMLDDPDQRKNLLAWFALEEVARWKCPDW